MLQTSPNRRTGWLRALAAGLSLGATAAAGTATTSAWNADAGGNWSPGTWTDGTPLLAGDEADLTFDINAIHTININTNVALGTLMIGDSSESPVAYTLALISGSLTLNNGAAHAVIQATATSAGDTISAPITLGSDLDLSNLATGKTLKISGALSGSHNLFITSANVGTVQLASTGNSYVGTVTVAGGTLSLGGANNATQIAGDIVINAGMLTYGNSGNQIADTANISINSGGTFNIVRTDTIGSLAVATGGTVSGSGTITINAAGALSIGTNVTVGPVLVTGSSGLVIGSGSSVDAGLTLNGNVTFNGSGAAARLTRQSKTLTINGQRTIDVALGTDPTADLGIFGNVVSGASGGGITKTGLGTLQITSNISTVADTSYTGPTTISAGTLKLTVGGSTVHNVIPNSPTIIVGSGATFDVSGVASNSFALADGQTLGGSGTIAGNLTVAAGSQLSPGNGGKGKLTMSSGNLTLPGTLAIEVGKAAAGKPVAGSDYDQLDVTGTVNVATGNLALTVGSGLQVGDILFIVNNDSNDAITSPFATLNGNNVNLAGGGSFTVNKVTFAISYIGDAGSGMLSGGNDIALDVTAVPEPTTATAFAAACIGLLARRRRRMRNTLHANEGNIRQAGR